MGDWLRDFEATAGHDGHAASGSPFCHIRQRSVMGKAISSFGALFAATFIFLIGIGLLNTLLSTRMALEGFSLLTNGVVLSGYYIGPFGRIFFLPSRGRAGWSYSCLHHFCRRHRGGGAVAWGGRIRFFLGTASLSLRLHLVRHVHGHRELAGMNAPNPNTGPGFFPSI